MANNKTESQKRFEALCNRQEALYRKDFEKVFRVLEADKEIKEALNTKGWNMCANIPKEISKERIDEALTQTGFSNDEAFCKSFIEYISITLEGKRLMQEFSTQLAKGHKENEPETESLNEWQFYPIISIIAPQQIQEKIINPMIEAQAIKGEGVFANSTNIPLEDEEEDEFLMIEAYNCNASMSGYWQELKDFGIIGIGKTDGFLPYQFKQCLLQLLKEVATYIKNNTDAPSKAKNKVTNTLKVLDKLPVWGLFFQILLLQGLCRWLENLDIDEKDPSIKEAQLFYNWLCKALAEKEMNFCFVPYGDEDKKLLKPLCDYLYTTDLGKAVQEHIFGKHQPEVTTQEPEQSTKEKKGTYQPIGNKKKGRPSKPFNSVLVGDEDKKKATLETLHNLMKEKTDSKAVLYIKVAISMGLIQKPTYTQFYKEFGQIASKAIYNKYVTQNLFSDDEIKGAKQALTNTP